MLLLPKVNRVTLGVRSLDWSNSELEVLCALVRNVNPKIVVEFGCNEGRTAQAILAGAPGIEQYVGVDVLPGYRCALPAQRHEVPKDAGWMVRHDPRFHLMLRRRGTLEMMPDDFPPADVVFIDGDHSRFVVERDTGLACQILKRPGMIIWKDYAELVDVREVLHELYKKGAPIQAVEDTSFAYMYLEKEAA